MSNGKVMIIHLIVGLIKNILLYKMSYFRKPHTNKNKIETELILSIMQQNLAYKRSKY